jgi:hypothetical protein
MGKKHEEEIEQKLHELEVSLKEATSSNVPAKVEKSTGLSAISERLAEGKVEGRQEGSTMVADLNLLGGSALMIVGLFVLLSNLTVMPGMLNLWGFGGNNGTGGLILLLLVGMGFFFYDYKSKIGWLLVICSLAALIYSVFATMHIMFAPMSLLSLILVFLPLVIGGGLLARGVKMHGQIREKRNSHDK